MEFKAEIKDGELIVKPIIEKKDGNVTIHVPSFQVIEEKKREFIENGKRDIQQV